MKDFRFHTFLARPVFVSEQPFALANTWPCGMGQTINK
jgi:hypothetical protein